MQNFVFIEIETMNFLLRPQFESGLRFLIIPNRFVFYDIYNSDILKILSKRYVQIFRQFWTLEKLVKT